MTEPGVDRVDIPRQLQSGGRLVDLGRIGLSVTEAGAGGRPLLTVHGFTGAKEDFGDWFEPLAREGWHVVAPDLRGHGASDRPGAEAAYSLETCTDDLLALVDHLGWDEFALLGHSMGGMLAQRLALRIPDRVRVLVLMDTSHQGLHQIPTQQVEAAQYVVRNLGTQALGRLLAAGSGPLATPAHVRVVAERPGYAEFGDRKMRDASAAMYAAVAAQITTFPDHLDELRALSMPTLVVVGEQDAPFIEPSKRMVDTIADARLAVIADAGHSPQFENPSAWWDVVAGFLAAQL